MPLLLLHGLGASAAVWDPLLATGSWDDGPVLVPDLPGHGGAAHTPPYSFGSFAAAAASGLEPGSHPVVLGHSLGGVIGLALASGWFGVQPRLVVAMGVKVAWSPEDLAGARALGERPPRVLPDREAALAWACRLAGLSQAPEGFAGTAVQELPDGTWTAKWDPRTALVGAPPLPHLLTAARCGTLLACGEHDHMVDVTQLRALQPEAVSLPGLPHNAHVEGPRAIWELLTAAGR